VIEYVYYVTKRSLSAHWKYDAHWDCSHVVRNSISLSYRLLGRTLPCLGRISYHSEYLGSQSWRDMIEHEGILVCRLSIHSQGSRTGVRSTRRPSRHPEIRHTGL